MPTSRHTGEIQLRSSENACTISVEPTLAPSMMARPVTGRIKPRAANDDAIMPVAVLLCSAPVIASPAQNAFNRLPRLLAMKRLSEAPNARIRPDSTI
ncbi:hypothetical protein QF000_001328 [Paraburkholderia atlantica]